MTLTSRASLADAREVVVGVLRQELHVGGRAVGVLPVALAVGVHAEHEVLLRPVRDLLDLVVLVLRVQARELAAVGRRAEVVGVLEGAAVRQTTTS